MPTQIEQKRRVDPDQRQGSRDGAVEAGEKLRRSIERVRKEFRSQDLSEAASKPSFKGFIRYYFYGQR